MYNNFLLHSQLTVRVFGVGQKMRILLWESVWRMGWMRESTVGGIGRVDTSLYMLSSLPSNPITLTHCPSLPSSYGRHPQYQTYPQLQPTLRIVGITPGSSQRLTVWSFKVFVVMFRDRRSMLVVFLCWLTIIRVSSCGCGPNCGCICGSNCGYSCGCICGCVGGYSRMMLCIIQLTSLVSSCSSYSSASNPNRQPSTTISLPVCGAGHTNLPSIMVHSFKCILLSVYSWIRWLGTIGMGQYVSIRG